MEKKNIAIIGAGLTGLTAAYRLALNGNKVTIYEKGGSVGGLASGFAINGTNLEKAYHHIFRTDKEIIRLSKELGIEKNLKWNNSSIGLYYEGKMYPFMSAADLLKFKPLSMVSKIRLGLTKIYLEKDKNWEKLVKKPAWLWMKQACGEQAYKVIWEPLLVGKFHEYYKNISMAWLWARIHTRGNSIEKGDSREKLGYFMGGFQAISDALVKKIKEMDGKIELDTTIEKIETKGNKVKVRVDGKDKIFDKVIASIPSEVFGRLIDKNKYKKYIEKL
ncbi:MAG TPA: FAD-dependent oxidoreductase, partial [Patescibacteria group bacterium]